ncbi:MAG: family 20 glycosylhydrolase [Phycisphaerales bacterium]|jgi:hypothetical protein|nr:family 20 glycosylhydrolase [Phycisphaerales bacterium]
MTDASTQLALCPRPRHVELTGGTLDVIPPLNVSGLSLDDPAFVLLPHAFRPCRDRSPSPGSCTLRVQRDPTLARDAENTIEIRPSNGAHGASIDVGYRDRPGMLAALATLAQLLDAPDPSPRRTLPALRIHDWPELPHRGVMIDVSRDRVPTMLELFDLVRLLASLKLNHLQLYTEHAFAYPGCEDVWSGVSALTPDEIHRLDAHARSLGVELAPNQNCFGHLTPWLRNPRFTHLAETHDLYDFYGIRRTGPFSLCPTDPRSLAFVRERLAGLLPCFTSSRVNIGCDETADVGQGRSASRVSELGRARVYWDFVHEVMAAARTHGRQPMFWADIALEHPEAASEIPRDAIALAWGYEPTSPFDRWTDTLAQAGVETWLCPGTSSWRSFIGRTRERRANLAACVDAARADTGRACVRGMLLTDWGDLGHRQQWPITLAAFARFAQAAWNPDTLDDPDHAAASHRVFGDASGRVQAWLDELGDADADLRAVSGLPASDGSPRPLANAGALFSDLHPARPDLGLPQNARPWRDVHDRLAELEHTRPATGNTLLDDELAHTLAVARFAADHAIWKRSDRDAGTARDLLASLDAITHDHARLWRVRSRPGGLVSSLSYYHAVRRGIEAPPA